MCEKCGKIATTVVTDYKGSEVFYTCKPDAANWVAGCGHSGWVSPFDGNGKLPWKVEWVAKWDVLGVTIEMAGKDHSQKGGSRDVANAICRKVLKKQPPFHSPYEFILVNGTKMSSSKGVGSSAKEIAELLPPELLRFLMLRTQPRTVINFAPNYETITRLLRDYDTLIDKYADNPDEATGEDGKLRKDFMPLFYAQIGDEVKAYNSFDFSTLISLLQIPHLDIKEEIAKRSSQPLTEFDWQIINQRIAAAQKWLQDYADEEEKLVIYLDQVPEKAGYLSPEQITYLEKLAENLEQLSNWEGEELQTTIFSTSKELEIKPAGAFQSIYLSFVGKERGPKAGSLLSYLDKSFVISRIQDVIEMNKSKI
ncbi:Lysyl-tRNA synthetase (class I) [Richelia intracellularis]|nr:Lysyl-tRNA synthetase (class I) [Richelia intracellularis]